MHHPTDRIAHTTAFVKPVVEHWLEREIAQWVHPKKDRSDDPSHHERTLLPWRYISLSTNDVLNNVYVKNLPPHLAFTQVIQCQGRRQMFSLFDVFAQNVGTDLQHSSFLLSIHSTSKKQNKKRMLVYCIVCF